MSYTSKGERRLSVVHKRSERAVGRDAEDDLPMGMTPLQRSDLWTHHDHLAVLDVLE